MRSIAGSQSFARGRRLAEVPEEGARPSAGYFSNLDARRGIAASVVVLFHVDEYSRLLARHLDSDFFPLLVLSAACGGRTVDTVLGARPLRRLGDWSYAIYMIHIPLLQTLFLLLMAGAIPEPASDQQLGLLFLGYVVVTIVLSGLVYRFVERPLRDSVKRWFSVPETRPC